MPTLNLSEDVLEKISSELIMVRSFLDLSVWSVQNTIIMANNNKVIIHELLL